MESTTGHDPRIGMVLQDRYRIVRKIGDGGMGAVYEGEHVVIKRKVAVKALHAQFAQNPEIVARFHREAEAATAIGHPNIIEVTDMGRFPDGTAYMVLEFLNGRDWSHDIEREGPQPLGKVVHIVSQVCDALTAAHAKGIVHRDLKPENIFLIERGGDPHFAKVLDFGISKIADSTSENRSLTQTGTALGTPYYMAPEQCQGRKDVDHRADIYSLGVILFQALTGQHPFDDESYPMLVLKICTEPPPAIEQWRPDLPGEVSATIERMLAKNPELRFGSIGEVKAALAPFRHVATAPVVVQAPSTASRGPSVLEARANTPHPAHHASTPTGTAVLPGSAPSLPAAPAPSSKGPLLAVVALLGLLALGAGGVGLAAALGAFARSEPVTGATRATPEPRPSRGPVEFVERGTPPSTEPASDPQRVPAAAPPPTEVAPARERVTITIEVQGPTQAEVLVDGVSWGSAPAVMEIERDAPPTPGDPVRLHTVEVRAQGWVTRTFQMPFQSSAPRTVRMERERAGRGGARLGGSELRAEPLGASPVQSPGSTSGGGPASVPATTSSGSLGGQTGSSTGGRGRLVNPFDTPTQGSRTPILSSGDVLR